MIGVGDTIGHLRVTAELGEGGMGRVLLARDDRLERDVALKTVRVGGTLDTAGRARLRREARVLSRLDHPAICQLYDLLEIGGEVLLVMERVEGESLAARLARDRPPRREALRIAEQVAAALAVAHAVSVVHRDVKPDNVMVRPDGSVKVVDFGIARTEREMATDLGAAATPPVDPEGLTVTGELLGTPRWMSPEQARGETATAASDMYSFGLLLHALVCDTPPYPLGLSAEETWRKAMWGDVRPPRLADPALRSLLQDLEAQEPGARPSAVEALERLRRILDRPRRRLVRGAAIAAVAGLVVGGIVSTVGLHQARRSLEIARVAEAAAAREAATARAVADFLADVFVVADPHSGGGGDVTARDILAAGAERIGRELADQPLLRARLMTTIGEVATRIGLYDQAEPLIDGGLAIRRAALGPTDPELADSLLARANLWRETGRHDLASPLYRQVVEIRRAATGDGSAETAAAVNYLARNAWDRGQWGEAETLYREAIAILEDTEGVAATSLAHPLNNLGLVYWKQARHDEAEVLLRRALEIRRGAYGEIHPDVAGSLNNLGNLLRDSGRYDEAARMLAESLALHEEMLGPDHMYTLDTVNNLAIVHARSGRFDDAARLYRRALEGFERTFGPGSERVANQLLNLGSLEIRRGRPEAALPLLERAGEVYLATIGREHPVAAYPIASAADALRDLGRHEEAERRYREALAIQEALLRPGHPDLVETLEGYAVMLERDGRAAEAAAVRKRAAGIGGAAR